MKNIISILSLSLFITVINAQIFDGNTLFTPYWIGDDSTTTLLMDNEYNIIHSWDHNFTPASMPYLLQDSTLIYPYKVLYPTMSAGGVGGGVQKISWDGNVIWEYIFSDEIYHFNIANFPVFTTGSPIPAATIYTTYIPFPTCFPEALLPLHVTRFTPSTPPVPPDTNDLLITFCCKPCYGLF